MCILYIIRYYKRVGKYTNDYQYNIMHNIKGRRYHNGINVLVISNYDIMFSIVNIKTFLHIFFETVVFDTNTVGRDNIYIFIFFFLTICSKCFILTSIALKRIVLIVCKLLRLSVICILTHNYNIKL
jgi:hypothetical protein